MENDQSRVSIRPLAPGRAGPLDALLDDVPGARPVLELLSRGMSNGEIGKKLFISDTTVKFHVGNILRKLGVSPPGRSRPSGRRASGRPVTP
jgi:hypothetical protein